MRIQSKSYAIKVRNRLRLIQLGYYKSLRTESQKLADDILVSTQDLLLLLPKAKYLPNPVDVDHFSKDDTNHNKVNNNNALTMKTESVDVQKTLLYCKENNINLNIEIFDCTKTPILHAEIPNFLKKYDIYVDIKIVNDKIIESLSKTGLESLACGLQVLNYKLEYIDKLPEKHHPLNVINQLQNIYNKIEGIESKTID